MRRRVHDDVDRGQGDRPGSVQVAADRRRAHRVQLPMGRRRTRQREDSMAMRDKLADEMRTEEAGTAGDQDLHRHFLFDMRARMACMA
jgi:hypothetical protein